MDQTATRTGFSKLGTENTGTLMTRAVLPDIAALKGVDIRGKLWGKDNARYLKTNPGIGVGAAEWLVKQDPMLVGSDNWSVEVVHNPDPKLNEPVHQILLTVNGIHMVESLKLDELAAKRFTEFAIVIEPLKIKGATGSTIAPVAIR